MGVAPPFALGLLAVSVGGSYINVPVAAFPFTSAAAVNDALVFGMHHVAPAAGTASHTVLAVNVGGALVPALISFYVVARNQLYWPALGGIAVVSCVCHMLAYSVPGAGIAVPIVIPPVIAAGMAWIVARHNAPALAYCSGTLGTLIGADLMNLPAVHALGAATVSIGGAGAFDGIFLIGLLSALIASLIRPRVPSQDGRLAG
jgi:uncharacterized membrane protein